MTKLLLDSDLTLYKIASAAEEELEVAEDVWIMSTNTESIMTSYLQHVEWLEDTLKGKVISVFSDSENFRKKVYPPYKASRKTVRKPMGYKVVKERIIEKYDARVLKYCEADDTLGILATGELEGKSIICSGDKDMQQIIGKLFNPYKPEEGVIDISEKSAMVSFFKQAVCGDMTDGYGGCPGVGEVRFEKEIEGKELTVEILWDITKRLFFSKNLTEKDALVQARCAKILTNSLYNHSKQQPILWTPSKGIK